MANAADLGRVVEQRADPLVEKVAVLAESPLGPAGVARGFDQRVLGPDTFA